MFGTVRTGLLVLSLALAVCAGACLPKGAPSPKRFTRVASLDTLGAMFRFPLKPDHAAEQNPPYVQQAAPQTSKIAPELVQMLQDSSATTRVRLIVSFRDTVTIPRFPDPDLTLDRDDPVNVAKRDTAAMLVHDIRIARGPQVAEDTLTVILHNGRPVHVFWLTQSMVALMELRDVTGLAAERTVRYVEPASIRALPPVGMSLMMPTAEEHAVQVAKGQINSEPFESLGLDYGWVGLYDTGVNTHALLMRDGDLDPDRVAERSDAVVDGCCVDGDIVSDIIEPEGHGTSTMSILTGNDSIDELYEGVTKASVHSFRVFWLDDSGTFWVCVEGAKAAIEEAAKELDPVLVMEFDMNSAESSLIGDCNNAFDAGRVVIAAAGNGTGVTAPSVAHRVIAVGGYDVVDAGRGTYSLGRHGDTDDGREKPDVIAPTDTRTGGIQDCNDGDECRDLAFFSGTSGAAPYAASAAILWRNWLSQYESPVDPGLVYAFMILSGRETNLADDRGAGPIRMPSDGWAWYGSCEVDASKTQPIEVDVPWEDAFAIEAAIWWPEDEDGDHSRLELEILDPTDASVGVGGADPASVFQRATVGDPGSADGWSPHTGVSTVAAPLATGKWTVNVTRSSSPTYAQKVYYAIVVRAETPPASGPLEKVVPDDDGWKGIPWTTVIMVLILGVILALVLRLILWRILRLLGSA